MDGDGVLGNAVTVRPRILVVAQRVPHALNSGWAMRTSAMLACLERVGSVDIVDVHSDEAFRYAPDGPQPARRLSRHGLGMTALAKREVVCRHLRSLDGGYDVAWLENFYTAQYAGLAAAKADRIILNTHNVESCLERQFFDQARSGFAKARSGLRWLNIRWAERRYLPSVDTVLAASEIDALTYSRWLGDDRVMLVPNSVNTDAYGELRRSPKSRSILFTGRLHYFPNRNGLRWFLAEVWPTLRSHVPDAHVVVVGAGDRGIATELQGPHVEIRGHVPSVAPYLETAAVSICPLHEGSGTRLKILEAMAAGVPVVATTKGAEGLDVTHERHLLIADEPAAFAQAVLSLLADSDLSARIAADARALVKTRYSWHATQDQLAELLSVGVRRA
jgi:glycosyltransferase involved in cell wall biosynthesis